MSFEVKLFKRSFSNMLFYLGNKKAINLDGVN